MGSSADTGRQRISLIEGANLTCPGCLAQGNSFRDFKPLERNEDYAHELNVVTIHRRDRGGCGHVFSLGEPRIIAAYLAGDLIPKEWLDSAKETIATLQDIVASLQHPVNEVENTEKDERRVST